MARHVLGGADVSAAEVAERFGFVDVSPPGVDGRTWRYVNESRSHAVLVEERHELWRAPGESSLLAEFRGWLSAARDLCDVAGEVDGPDFRDGPVRLVRLEAEVVLAVPRAQVRVAHEAARWPDE